MSFVRFNRSVNYKHKTFIEFLPIDSLSAYESCLAFSKDWNCKMIKCI